MKSITPIFATVIVLFTVSFTAAGQFVDKLTTGDVQDIAHTSPVSLQTISSTASGGAWSSPSTWVGGVVPGENDSVTIAGGATVIVDTVAKAAGVAVGGAGSRGETKRFAWTESSPARLTFDETSARSLIIGGDLVIGPNDSFSTGGGSVNSHILSIGGGLTNDGTLDLSTNGNLAGATIKFTGSGNSVLGGNGAVTDVYRIEVGKSAPGAITELISVNFTVQGSNGDTPGSGYLDLTGGIFKISGTFTGSYKTFSAAAYSVPAGAGLWLNNPNYAVVAQPASAEVRGSLRVSAGTYSVGTVNAHSFKVDSTSNFMMEGGKINAAGDFGARSPASTISGGTITSCIATPTPNCLMEFIDSGATGSVVMSGGDLVLQNSGAYRYTAPAPAAGNLRGTKLHFGSGLTSGPGFFWVLGMAPNVILDTSAVPVTVSTDGWATHMNDLNVGVGGILTFRFLNLHGNNIVNNGDIKKTCQAPFPDPVCESAVLEFDDLTGTTDTTYSGAGTFSEYVNEIKIRARNMAFESASGLKAYSLSVTNARVLNSGRIKLGNHNNTQTNTSLADGASLDSSPVFDISPLWLQNVSYRGVSSTGPEINASRQVGTMSFRGPGVLTLTGGDLIVGTTLSILNGVISTGGSTITTFGAINGMPTGYVDGNLKTWFRASQSSTFSTIVKVGNNGTYSPATVTPVSGEGYLTVRAVDATLSGLLPSASASRYWEIAEEGNLVARLTLTPDASDINGNPALYQKYRSNGGAPVLVSETDIDQLTGNWGLGVADAPVAVSGRVTTAGGQPIRNATVTISGGNLPAPVVYSTGNFGIYNFVGLQPGAVYTITASAKRYRFAAGSITVTPVGNIADANFTANPPE